MTDDPFDALAWGVPLDDAPPPLAPATPEPPPDSAEAASLPFAPPVQRPSADDGFLLRGFDAPGEGFHPRLRRHGGAA